LREREREEEEVVIGRREGEGGKRYSSHNTLLI
jgi:hypothetical protein